MEAVKSFSKLDVKKIQKFLADCDQHFETSQLYSSTRDEKFTDKDLRKSVFRPIVNQELFDLVDDVVAKLNVTETSYNFTLRKNDVTHIKYEQGGYFKRHRDYLSTTSNLIEEFTLLICVTPDDLAKDVEGGGTTIFTYGGAKTFDTTATGSGVLFRKDLEHEGVELKSGEKHIITANIWATRKQRSGQVLLVTFPADSGNDEKSTNASTMEQIANPSMSYVLPVDILSGMLKAHVEWANRQADQEEKDIPPIVTYECRDFDYDTFGVVEKILNRSYVEEKEINNAKACLDFFGPFKAENILVDLSTRICAACGKTDGQVKQCACGLVRYCNKECQLAHRKDHKKECKERLAEIKLESTASTKGKSISNGNKKARVGSSPDPGLAPKNTLNNDIIVCETEARMLAVCNCAKALGEPYVPFKLLFVEGVLEYMCEAHGAEAVDVPMTTAACLVGDYDNIFCLRTIAQSSSIKPRSLEEIQKSYNLFKMIPESEAKKISGVEPGQEIDLFRPSGDMKWNIDYNLVCEMRENGYGLGLRVGLQATKTWDSEEGDTKAAVINSVLHEGYDMLGRGGKTIHLPGIEKGRDKEEQDGSTSLFHRNEDGRICFTAQEADRASEFIASIGLEDRVKASLQKKQFVLPQMTESVSANFCNEAVYGNVNILWVCGAIRMEANNDNGVGGATSSNSFNAWPSQLAKAKTKYERSTIDSHASLGSDIFSMMGDY